MKRFGSIARALAALRGPAAVKCLLVAALCGLIGVAVIDALSGRFGPAPAAFTAARPVSGH